MATVLALGGLLLPAPSTFAQTGFAGISFDQGCPSLTVTGQVGSICEISCIDSLGGGLPWRTFAVAVLSNSSQVQLIDQTSPLPDSRFYAMIYIGTLPTNVIYVPPQTFLMGSPTNEADRYLDEGPQTLVTLTRGFFIGQFEVTQAEYASLMLTNPSYFQGDLTRPVERVSWADATNYCQALTLRERQAGRLGQSWAYRLPTEAEWECACRAGTTNRFSYGDDPTYSSTANYAWYLANASDTTHPAGAKLPNPYGAFDMHGNVWEWCLDRFGFYAGGSSTNPTGPPSGRTRITRGGAWNNAPKGCRSATRGNEDPSNCFDSIGFRIVLAPPAGS